MNPLASLRTLPNLAMCHLAMKLGDGAPRGANAAYSPFDAASIEAVGAAAEAVRRGECDVALAGGADSLLSVFGWTMLKRLELLSANRRAGEGAALFVVETAKRAQDGGRPILAEIAGFGSAADSSPVGKPTIAGAKQAIRAALAWGATKPALVDVAVLSGVSADHVGFETVVKEASSTRRLGRPAPKVIQPRAVLGESGAGSGALNVALALSEIAHGATRALATGSAWGGSHAALVLKRWKP
jgi:3-oxoacyl-[acyl-carrier-protein] synthase II